MTTKKKTYQIEVFRRYDDGYETTEWIWSVDQRMRYNTCTSQAQAHTFTRKSPVRRVVKSLWGEKSTVGITVHRKVTIVEETKITDMRKL